LRKRVVAIAADPAIRVRFQVAFTLGEIAETDPTAVRALAALVRRDVGDSWVRTAVLSSSSRVAGPLFESIVADVEGLSNVGGLALLHDLAGLVGATGDLGEVGLLLERVASGPIARGAPELLEEVLLGLGEGLARAGRKTLRDALTGSPVAGALLNSVLEKSAATATDGRADLARRGRAVALMGQAEFVTANAALRGLLVPGEPQQVQLAAIRALATFTDPAVATLLVGRWSGLTPAPRSEVIARLLSRPAWTKALLDAIEAGTIPASVIPPNRRSLLLADRDPATRDRARSLLGGASAGPRDVAYARYRPALELPPDRRRGERVFGRECMTCHKLGERGHAVGPNLASVQRRTPEEVLLHILDPNREVAPDYLEYAVALDDGRVLTGLVAAETAGSLTLRRAEGSEDTVLRSNIAAITGTGKSLMPEGLEARVSPPEMADLIAFILGVQQ
jgi:putative heme-binding domain-containing protein